MLNVPQTGVVDGTLGGVGGGGGANGSMPFVDDNVTLGSVAHVYNGAPSPRFFWYNASDTMIGRAVGAVCCYSGAFGGGGAYDTATSSSVAATTTTTASTATIATASSGALARTAVAQLSFDPRVVGAVTFSQLSPAHAITASIDLQVCGCVCVCVCV